MSVDPDVSPDVTVRDVLLAEIATLHAERDRLKRVPGMHWRLDQIMAECGALFDQVRELDGRP